MADRWVKDAKKQNGKGWRLAFDREDTWSMKYNIVWDRLLGLGLFDAAVSEEEQKVYTKQMNRYGVPLDCRSDYTKLDAQILSTENAVIIAGKTSNRDDRVSIFVDSITPLSEWVAKIAKKITMNIRDRMVLQDLKKAIIALPRGYTRVELVLHGADKVATVALPGGVELGSTTIADLTALGLKVEIE